jgi:ABC-type sugar transport system permease subunit
VIRQFFPTAELNWMSSPLLARPAVIMAAVWLNVGFGMIYFLAALQAVDQELYEAAEVDGAGRWQRFWHITVPGIRPVLLFMIITGTISGLQIFELPYLLFRGGGPGNAGLTVVSYLFGWVEMGELGTAAAVGWMLAFVVIVVSLFQVRVLARAK